MARSLKLKLDPNACDRCGRCLAVCEVDALKVGASYIFVDWRVCDSCGKCAQACDRGAITIRGAEVRPKPADRKPPAKRKASSGRSRVGAALYDWTVLEAMAVLAIVFVAFMGKDAVLTTEWALSLRPSEAVWLRVAVLAVFYAIQIGALFALAKLREIDLVEGLGLGRLGTSWQQKIDSIAAVVGLLLATRVLAWIYGVTVQGLGWEPPVRWNSELTAVFGPDALGLSLAILMVVVVGPIVEEIVFRGVLMRAFQARFGAWVAIVVSAALFAGYHFNLWLFVPTMVLGVAAGWLASSRDSLWPAIAMHALYNVIPVAMAFYLAA